MKNPDTQYLRYKQLMNSQYYNLNANTTMPEEEKAGRYGGIYGDSRKVYELPSRYLTTNSELVNPERQLS